MTVQIDSTETISSLDKLARRQQRRIKKLLKVGKRRAAKILMECSKGHRCDHPDCVICESEAKKTVEASFLVHHIRLDAIEVPSNRRQLDADKLKALDASVELLGGFRTPITVLEKVDKESGAKKYYVVAGAYRVEVANRRGWDTIPCFVVRRTPKARLWGEAEKSVPGRAKCPRARGKHRKGSRRCLSRGG